MCYAHVFRGSGRRSCGAFTLLELTVVVAIGAVGIAILVPAMVAAKEASKAQICASKMDQFTRTVNAYTAENRGEWLLAGDPQAYGNGASIIGSERDFAVRLAPSALRSSPGGGR